MNENELTQAIESLETALSGFEGIEFVEQQTKLLELKNEVAGRVFDSVIADLQAIPEFDAQEFRKLVAAANDATKARQAQVDAFNSAVGFLRRAVGLVL